MIGIRDLRRDLAAHVRRAAAGTPVVIAVGGRAVARLTPLSSTGDSADLDALVAIGALVAPRRVGPDRPAEPIAIWPGTRLDRVLREVRG